MRPWVIKGRVLVIHARTGADQLPFAEMQTELTTLLQQSLISGTI
jgi:RNase P protein component